MCLSIEGSASMSYVRLSLRISNMMLNLDYNSIFSPFFSIVMACSLLVLFVGAFSSRMSIQS